MSKALKKLIVDELVTDYKGKKNLVLANFKGINAHQSNVLRSDLREKNINVKVVKNSLAAIAFKEGKIEYRTDAGGNVHVPVGKTSFSEEDLVENLRSFIKHIVSNKPPAAKGIFVQKISISSSMSPGVRVALAS